VASLAAKNDHHFSASRLTLSLSQPGAIVGVTHPTHLNYEVAQDRRKQQANELASPPMGSSSPLCPTVEMWAGLRGPGRFAGGFLGRPARVVLIRGCCTPMVCPLREQGEAELAIAHAIAGRFSKDNMH
jgi:hypothetical protein